MQPATTFFSSILLLGAAHGVFLALALINVRRGNKIALRLLALLTLTFAADIGVDYLITSRYLEYFPRLVFVELVTSFLYGPLSYLYVRALTSRIDFHFSAKTWLHFLPFFVSILLLIPFFFLSDQNILDMIYLDADIDEKIGLWLIGGLLVQALPIPLIGVYLTLAVRRLIRHGRDIRDEFSYIEQISLIWLRNLLIALGGLYVLYLGISVLDLGYSSDSHPENLLSLSMVIVIYTIGYLGMRQPRIFAQPRRVIKKDTGQEVTIDDIEVAVVKAKYQRSALDAETSALLLRELQALMADSKPFLDSKLTLLQLAGQLGVSPNYLSQTINQQTGSNFFDYVNSHRVEYAKKILSDPSRSGTGVLTIAMDSGFNSKSAFYTAFKQHANVTPTQYRRSKTS